MSKLDDFPITSDEEQETRNLSTVSYEPQKADSTKTYKLVSKTQTLAYQAKFPIDEDLKILFLDQDRTEYSI